VKKNWLLTIILALMVVIVSLVGCSPSNTAAPINVEGLNINNQQEGIWVSGRGTGTVTPDIAIIRLGVETQGDSVATVQSEATEAMEQVMVALTDNGVARKDIQTQYYYIRQVTQWDRVKEEEVVVGYEVIHTVNVKIREIDKTGTVIDAVVTAAGDRIRINSINFSVDDPTDYYDEAREEAMANAKAKAEQLAELAGGRLGNAIYISESSQTPSVYRQDVGVSVEEAAVAGTSISPGELEISLTVQVGYGLQY
jgi:uncharacterized protein YggE